MIDFARNPEDIEQALIALWQEKSRISAFDVQRAEALRAGSRLSLSELLVNNPNLYRLCNMDILQYTKPCGYSQSPLAETSYRLV